MPKYEAAFDRAAELSASNVDIVDQVNADIAGKFAVDAAFIRDSAVEDQKTIEAETVLCHRLVAELQQSSSPCSASSSAARSPG